LEIESVELAVASRDNIVILKTSLAQNLELSIGETMFEEIT